MAIACEKCGAQGINLPCPACGWAGEAVEKRVRPKRNLPLLLLSAVLIVTGGLGSCNGVLSLMRLGVCGGVIAIGLGGAIAALGYWVLRKSRGT